MNRVEQALAENADELGLAALGLDHRLQTTLLTPRFPTSRHVVALLFAPGERRPRAVAKIPRIPGDNAGVLTEAQLLRRLHHLADEDVTGVPTVLGTVDLDNRTILVETAAEGDPLGPARVLRDLDRAVAAGASFLSRLPVTREAGENRDWYDECLTAPLAALDHLVRADSEVRHLSARTHALLHPLRGVPLPAVFEHGDLSYSNLFLADGGRTLCVIDWERATEAGLPGHDFTFFLQYLSQCRYGVTPRSALHTAFDRAFVGRHAWARPVLAAHLADRGVDPGLTGLLILASWARTAATLVSRLGADQPGGAGATAALTEAVREDRDVVVWEHAVRRAEEGALLGSE